MPSHAMTLLATFIFFTLALAKNIITFNSVDDTDRTVMFTSAEGKEKLMPVSVPAGQSLDVEVPHGWVGNYLAFEVGQEHIPGAGVIGEVTFNGFEDKTYFDVSAIDDPDDQAGVRMLWPADDVDNTSGCEEEDFPCANAYTKPKDRQTKVTEKKHLIATLGRFPVDEDEWDEGDEGDEGDEEDEGDEGDWKR